MDELLEKEYKGECNCGIKVVVQVPIYNNMNRTITCPADPYCDGKIYLQRTVKTKSAAPNGTTKGAGSSLWTK